MWKKFLPATRRAFVLGALAMGAYACQHEPPVAPEDPLGGGGGNGGGGTNNPCSPTTVYFQQQVLPILQSNCTNPGEGLNCHHTANDANDWIALTSYQSLMNSGIVGDGDLMEAITDNDPDDRMPRPPQNPLTPQQIQLIQTWIQQGAQNNSCAQAGCDTTNVTYAGTIVPLVQQRCLGCHSGGSPSGDLNFDNWLTLNAVADDGRLRWAVTHDPQGVPMPPSAPQLPPCEVRKFILWIEAGAPNN